MIVNYNIIDQKKLSSVLSERGPKIIQKKEPRERIYGYLRRAFYSSRPEFFPLLYKTKTLVRALCKKYIL